MLRNFITTRHCPDCKFEEETVVSYFSNQHSVVTKMTELALEGKLCRRVKISPVTGLEWPRGFQEVKFPRFHHNGTGLW